jgi:hypothetical protein
LRVRASVDAPLGSTTSVLDRDGPSLCGTALFAFATGPPTRSFGFGFGFDIGFGFGCRLGLGLIRRLDHTGLVFGRFVGIRRPGHLDPALACSADRIS